MRVSDNTPKESINKKIDNKMDEVLLKKLVKSDKKLKIILEECAKKMDEYCSIVWYARSSSMKQEVVDARKRVEEKYPNLIQELREDDDNWQHGFNSGMLAATRYIMTIVDEGLEQADEEFPLLDT
jgi:chaperonin GroEL (HSP60 family)